MLHSDRTDNNGLREICEPLTPVKNGRVLLRYTLGAHTTEAWVRVERDCRNHWFYLPMPKKITKIMALYPLD